MSHRKNSAEILQFLESQKLLERAPKYWWPNAGSFEVVVGAILTQNTTWQSVERSLKNLEGSLLLEQFVGLEEERLKELIQPSGFQNQKAPRLLLLAQNIQNVFHDFKSFQKEVTREWLLAQKGIGEESADAILCYGCFRAEMVVDSYTKRLLKHFGIEFKKYGEYKEYLEEGVGEEEDKNLLFARYHGMIVEYNKLKPFK